MVFKKLLQSVKQLPASRSIHCFGAIWLLMANLAIAAETPPATPQQGLLVLTNGSILQGVISREGEKYRIMLPKGELQVRSTEVDFFCHNMSEAYAHRRELRRFATADAHLEMVRWCLQHGLLDHARAELEEARAMEPHLPQLDVLSRQIDYLGRDKSPTNKPPSTEPARTSPEVPTTESSVRSSEFPQWARVEFVRRIQPMLIHSCATGGCHCPGSSQKMQVNREALSGIGSPELIQQNLESVFRMVDLSDPEASPLLTHALAVHGTVQGEHSEAFTPRQAAIMRAWIAQLTEDQSENSISTNGPTIEATQEGKELDILAAKPVRNGAELDRFQVRDPFDPDLFNRNRDSTSSESSEATRSTKESDSDLPLQEVP